MRTRGRMPARPRRLGAVVSAVGLVAATLLVGQQAQAAPAGTLQVTPSSTAASPLVVPPSGVAVTVRNTDRRKSTSALVTVLSSADPGYSTVDGCSGVALGPGKSCTVTVTYAGEAPWPSSRATLTVASKKPGVITSVSSHLIVAAPCARNLTAGDAPSDDLQAVIDAAASGDTIQVNGTCTGTFTVDKDLALAGVAGTQPTLDAGDAGRTLTIDEAGADVTLDDLTVTGGLLPDELASAGGGIRNLGRLLLGGTTVVRDNSAGVYGKGGGVWNSGTLVLADTSSVRDNFANYGAGIYNAAGGAVALTGFAAVTSNDGDFAGYGAGISNWGSVTMDDTSSISDNAFPWGGTGGGIENRGTLTMNDQSSISGNVTATFGDGGGIFNWGTATLNDSATVTGNSADGGGGIYHNGGGTGVLRLNGSVLVSGNSATYGGGISRQTGRMILSGGASVTGNTATASDGGFYGGAPEVCDASGADEWIGAISPNIPDTPPTPIPIVC